MGEVLLVSSTEILTEEESEEARRARRLMHFIVDDCPEADIVRMLGIVLLRFPEIASF